jgi:hypothetical protein
MDMSSKQHWELAEDVDPCNTTDNPTFESVLAARLSRRRLLTGPPPDWRYSAPVPCASHGLPAHSLQAGSCR